MCRYFGNAEVVFPRPPVTAGQPLSPNAIRSQGPSVQTFHALGLHYPAVCPVGRLVVRLIKEPKPLPLIQQ